MIAILCIITMAMFLHEVVFVVHTLYKNKKLHLNNTFKQNCKNTNILPMSVMQMTYACTP